MELSTSIQAKLLDFQLCSAIEFPSEQPKINLASTTLNIEELRAKTASIVSRAHNDPETERDFRKTCSLYKNQTSDVSLSQAFQEYVSAYHKLTSLYLIQEENGKTNFIIYNTENEKEEIKVLRSLKTLTPYTCIAQLPNGELFCFGNNPLSGITLIIDCNWEFIELPPSGTPCYFSSAIYFKRNVYCFGGVGDWGNVTLSARFDLDRNQWIELVPMPESDRNCHSVIFNGNILIAGYRYRNLWAYSIDINSYSEILYPFPGFIQKILIKVEERLYLIEGHMCGQVYESDIGNEYAWKQVAYVQLIDNPLVLYFSYNKGGIYISIFSSTIRNSDGRYYKFELNKKFLRWIK